MGRFVSEWNGWMHIPKAQNSVGEFQVALSSCGHPQGHTYIICYIHHMYILHIQFSIENILFSNIYAWNHKWLYEFCNDDDDKLMLNKVFALNVVYMFKILTSTTDKPMFIKRYSSSCDDDNGKPFIIFFLNTDFNLEMGNFELTLT